MFETTNQPLNIIKSYHQFCWSNRKITQDFLVDFHDFSPGKITSSTVKSPMKSVEKLWKILGQPAAACLVASSP